MPRKSTNPWLNRGWKLIAAPGPSTPLMVKRRTARTGDNEFRLVAGSKTGSRINFYKVKPSKSGAMASPWNSCVLVPRGTEPVALVDSSGTAIAPLGPSPTEAAIAAVAKQLVGAIDNASRINTSRLECDVTVPEFAFDSATSTFKATGKQLFGQLRLFQVPKAVGNLRLLIVDFAVQGGLPGGSGAGSSVIP